MCVAERAAENMVAGCENGWTLDSGGMSCLWLGTQAVNWQAAVSACEEYGAALVSTHDEREHNLLVQL